MATPVVVVEKYGTPVKNTGWGAPVTEVSKFGIPVVLSDHGAPVRFITMVQPVAPASTYVQPGYVSNGYVE